MFEVLTVKEALDKILNSIEIIEKGKEEIDILQALGRVTAEDIKSTSAVPHFSRSTMDGFVVRARDTFGASETMPAFLTMKGDIHMGGVPPGEIRPGETMAIATGGMLPHGADSVIMVEHTEELDEKMIAVYRPAAPGENVILRGEDFKKGDTILKKNHRLRPQDVGVLAAAGITRINVFPQPHVAVISTGDELVPPEEEPLPGQIRDINSCALGAAIKSAGALPILCGIIKDEALLLKKALEEAMEMAGLILISGGSSVGIRDNTARVIDQLGDPGVLIHGISIKPGKPTIFGMVGKTPVFGLSGNPVSALVTFDLFVAPVIYRMRGLKPKDLFQHKIQVRVSRNIPSAHGQEDCVRVMLQKDESGETWAVPIFGKSGLITTLVEAEGIIIISQNKEGLEKGEKVEVIIY